jgi:hypothetical protein
MQSKKAAALRLAWDGKPCTHPTLSKEYDLGAQTGNYLCGQCGQAFSARERREIVDRAKPRPSAE